MVTLKNVGKSFMENGAMTDILSHVNLEISQGDFIAVQGPSGCGKSTLMLTIGGLLKPQEGSVCIDGKDVYSLNDNERTRLRSEKIGFIFQEFYLVPYLTVMENILAAAMPLKKRPHPEIRAWELVNRFNINHRANHLSEKLSTGEKQRTALCRALINGPRLLLADEPTGNLDADNAGKLCDYFDSYVKEGGTVLMVTHNVSIAARAARRMTIKDGAFVDG